ncbi:helix-turn-helix domain-containing protein [Actinacidiphila bryophytorum]|uniref:Helix-turn-helix domain-containing protein n=1 Tax=Actinacidiphila bryophytorum TaxID=1436133 RepID=A0A9W4GVW3_9ACTN|nr:helix-turn-helix transcriptional regulator [Actinacidiphila bryophytorum]MBM9436629.1 helix-turn-helix domain-containing protein [Actinacidiphila bryophytorum]MBN6546715.1 helix-turn-helix domain-containing protein [Actinacidiphila bryophytorum]CAG7599136.1 Helix-turn-helix domain-containing protein [Actinacidiphila bryophytorum]
MTIGEGRNYTTDGADGPDWDSGLEDDSTSVMKTVGRQIKAWREAAGLTQAEFGSAIGYGEEMVSKVERGVRVPKPAFLDNADRVLEAGGRLAAMKPDVAEARYPKKVRDLTKLEAEAVELGAYSNHNMHGLLQTEDYARSLFGMRRPTYTEDQIDRQVEGRIARQMVFQRQPTPTLAFVLEEVTLRRPLGGKDVLRRQLDHLLEIGKLRHVEIQVMPTDREDHAGMGGELRVLKLGDGSTVGYSEAQLTSRLISEPREVQILELRYGIIRSQALTPRESLAFIKKVRGEI